MFFREGSQSFAFDNPHQVRGRLISRAIFRGVLFAKTMGGLFQLAAVMAIKEGFAPFTPENAADTGKRMCLGSPTTKVQVW